MANRNKRNGTQYERQTRQALSDLGLTVTRLAEGGMYDPGDLLVEELDLVVEARWRQAMSAHTALRKALTKARAQGHSSAVVAWKRTLPTETGGPRQPTGERELYLVPKALMEELLQIACEQTQ